MGFGTALALGFIQQTNKNMAEKRAAEAEAAKAGKEAEINRREGISSLVSTLVQKEMLDPTKAAQLTYSNTQGLVTMSDVYSAVNVMDDVENSTILSPNLKLPFTIDITDGGKTQDTLLNFDSTLAGQNFDILIQGLEQDQIARDKLESITRSVFTNQNTYYHKLNSFDGTGNFLENKYYDYSKGAPNFKRLTDYFGITGTSRYDDVPEMVSTSELTSGRPLGDNEFVVKVGDDSTTAPVTFKNLAGEYGVPTERLTNGLEVIADIQDMNGPQHVIYNAQELSYGDQTVAYDVANTARAAILASTGAQNLPNLNIQEDQVTMDKVTKVVSKFGGGTPENNYSDENVFDVKQSIFAITKIESQYETAPPSTMTGISGSDYAISKKINISEFTNQYSATQETVKMLKQLRALYEVQDETGLYLTLKRFGIGVVVQAKQFSTMFNDPNSDLLNKNLKEKTTMGSLQKVLENLKYDIKNLSTIDALKISLAAKMARAIDPSGRLSNQDFEVQLQLLGDSGFFDLGKTGRQGKLDQLIKEFSSREKDMTDTNDIINKQEITAEDRRWLTATASYRKIDRYRKDMLAAQDQYADQDTEDDLDLNIIDSDKILKENSALTEAFGIPIYNIDGGGFAYIDEKTGNYVKIDTYDFDPTKVNADKE
jgi:hypothetical protein